MTSEERRTKILTSIEQSEKPISASVLSKQFHVSRQSIVGDVALLRASGIKIIATTRGYLLESNVYQDRYIRKIACYHSTHDAIIELETVVRHGGEILDVIIEHNLYGEFTGCLNIATQDDIEYFIQKKQNSNVHLLSELTSGIHFHTIATKDPDTLETIKQELLEKNILIFNV